MRPASLILAVLLGLHAIPQAACAAPSGAAPSGAAPSGAAAPAGTGTPASHILATGGPAAGVFGNLAARGPGSAPGLRPSFDAAPTPDPAPASPATASRVAPPTLPLFGLFPAVELRTALVAVHLLGLCFGLGGSTLLYFWIFRWIRWGGLPPDIVRTFDFVAKTVAVGLVLLWLSGLGFLACYEAWDPGKLANPKLWAKLVIVTALSLNGLLVHRRVSPFVRAAAASPLLKYETAGRRLLFIASGTVSGTSWYAAFALGLLREFNGTVPAGSILAAWGLAMAAVFAGLSLVLSRGRRAAGTTAERRREDFGGRRQRPVFGAGA